MPEQHVSPAPVSAGSRRRRLWDLPHQCHGPLVGLCIPPLELRQLVCHAQGTTVAEDLTVQVGAVAECAQRNRLSELLQQYLDDRYAGSVLAFQVAQDTKSVAALWADAVRRGEAAGAFWAALTQPLCDAALQEAILNDMHMWHYQAGVEFRIYATRLHELIRENGVLARELGKVQERCTRVLAEKASEVAQLHVQLMQQRALLMGKVTLISFLQQDMEQLKAALPDHEYASRLRKKLDQYTDRQAVLEAQNARLRQQLSEAQRALSLREKDALAVSAVEQRGGPLKESPITFHPKKKTVLCVGGRKGDVANYRNVIEKAGGNFAHHDRELEDNQNALDTALAAADLVICQTGCISHNAYWRVQDFCKRTGKQCVLVENPSTSALRHTLRQITGGDIQGELAENASGESPATHHFQERSRPWTKT